MPETGAIQWPAHKASLHVVHNQHLAYYQTAADYIEDLPRDLFPDEAERQRAIETGEIWVIQWYPDTPVGFCRVAAATFERALEAANA